MSVVYNRKCWNLYTCCIIYPFSLVCVCVCVSSFFLFFVSLPVSFFVSVFCFSVSLCFSVPLCLSVPLCFSVPLCLSVSLCLCLSLYFSLSIGCTTVCMQFLSHLLSSFTVSPSSLFPSHSLCFDCSNYKYTLSLIAQFI